MMAVYAPPQANAKLAVEKLYDSANKQLTAHPNSLIIVAGDFNHVDFKLVMPKLKNVTFPTRENNILDKVYTNIPGAFKARQSAHMGQSDRISLILTPVHRSRGCREKPISKTALL